MSSWAQRKHTRYYQAATHSVLSTMLENVSSFQNMRLIRVCSSLLNKSHSIISIIIFIIIMIMCVYGVTCSQSSETKPVQNQQTNKDRDRDRERKKYTHEHRALCIQKYISQMGCINWSLWIHVNSNNVKKTENNHSHPIHPSD